MTPNAHRRLALAVIAAGYLGLVALVAWGIDSIPEGPFKKPRQVDQRVQLTNELFTALDMTSITPIVSSDGCVKNWLRGACGVTFTARRDGVPVGVVVLWTIQRNGGGP